MRQYRPLHPRQGLQSIGGSVYAVALFFEELLERVANVAVVFDYQYPALLHQLIFAQRGRPAQSLFVPFYVFE